MRKSLQFALAAGSMFIFASAAMAQATTVRLQSAIPGPTADCPRVRAILSTTLDDLARASFPAQWDVQAVVPFTLEETRAPDRASKPD